MAGKVTKNVIYTPWRILQLCPDLRTLQWWYRRTRADNRDDSILLSLISEFERDGMTFASALDFCPELLVKEGILTRRAPTPSEQKDIEFGWTLAKEMGRLDVGQSVAVKELATLAVEAIEGTDRCIERAGQFCRAGGWSLVKVAKPQQDMRFDVPTIGVTTIENLHKAGAKVLAIEAGKTILLDEPDVIALADRYGLTIVAIRNGARAQARLIEGPSSSSLIHVRARIGRTAGEGTAHSAKPPACLRRADCSPGACGRLEARRWRGRLTHARRQSVRPPGSHGAYNHLGGDLQTQAVRVEHQVEVVRVVRVGPVHRPVELSAAPVELSGGPPRRARRHPHPLGQSLGSHLERGDDPDG